MSVTFKNGFEKAFLTLLLLRRCLVKGLFQSLPEAPCIPLELDRFGLDPVSDYTLISFSMGGVILIINKNVFRHIALKIFWYPLKPRSCWSPDCCSHTGRKWKAQAQPFCLRFPGDRDWKAEAVQHLIVVPRFLAVIARVRGLWAGTGALIWVKSFPKEDLLLGFVSMLHSSFWNCCSWSLFLLLHKNNLP